MDKFLVICVDRDNDIGEKLKGIKAPIIGRKENLRVATRLVLEDPEESDANCIFAGIKEYDRLKRQNKKVEIVTLLGDKEVGTLSDLKIERQLQEVLSKIKPTKAIFVSDGAEDEFVIPIIQSYIPIASVRRVIIRQSRNLESSYYFLYKYFKEALSNPEVRRLIYGIPALFLFLYAIFGPLGWRIIFGLIGFYLIIKGFGLEGIISGILYELYSTLRTGKLSFFCYVIGILFILISIIEGYTSFALYSSQSMLQGVLYFLYSTLNYLLFSAIFFWIGRVIKVYTKRRKAGREITLLALILSIYLVLSTSLRYLFVPNYSIINVFLATVAGFFLLFVFHSLEKTVSE